MNCVLSPSSLNHQDSFTHSPAQVKYWALGNEVWGPWQVEQTTKEAYAHKALQWAKGKPPCIIVKLHRSKGEKRPCSDTD